MTLESSQNNKSETTNYLELTDDYVLNNIDLKYFFYEHAEQSLMKILMVALGVYRGGEIALYKTNFKLLENGSKQLIYEMPEQDLVDYVIDQLTKLGLKTLVVTSNKVDIYYSKNSMDASKIDSHETAGSFFDYPDTAIKAFPDESIEINELPDDINDHPYEAFLPFRMSKKHFREEWNDFVEKVGIVQKKLPKTFQWILDEIKASYSK